MRYALMVLLLPIVLLASGCFSASVRDWVAERYEPRPDEQGARVFHAAEPPSAVAAAISKARPPGDRRVSTSGVFLRYSRDMVAVLPDPAGGSKIMIADERRGYTMFYPYVGGFWGTYSGPGETFRGGGPGAGK